MPKSHDGESYELPNINSPGPEGEPLASSMEEAEENQHDQPIDPNFERRTLRKLDWILLPFLSLLFLLNSLDRSNIGNAETAHFTQDAGLSPSDLNNSVALFFGFFVALQPVGAALGRRFGMARYVPTVMALWGICTTLHIWVRKRWQLMLLRSIIGMLEAGFYPTTVAYLSLFYTRYEFARRLGFFYGQYAVAGALGGILAFVVFSIFPMHKEEEAAKTEGWMSWQVLFLIEGLLTVAIAVIGLVWLPHSAATAWFLSREERNWAEERVRRDRMSVAEPTPSPSGTIAASDIQQTEDDREENTNDQNTRLLGDTPEESDDPPVYRSTKVSNSSLTADSGLSKADFLSTILALPTILFLLVVNILSALPATAFSVFLPLILSAKGESSESVVNLLVAPPFLAAAVTLFTFTYWSDHIRQRIMPILVGLGIAALGLVLTLSIPSSSVIPSYLALCVLLSGSFIASPLTVAWFAGNIPEPGKRAIVLGINGWGNLAGVLSSLLFSPKFEATGYRLPLGVTLVAVLLSGLGFAGFRMLLTQRNHWRRKFLSTWGPADVEREQKWGIGGNSSNQGIWDQWVRNYIGIQLLRMDPEDAQKRRGDEKLTFSYEL
ncbi:MAG: hypothetical protein Q9227_003792 [Pyrenula ochraceoflavens]